MFRVVMILLVLCGLSGCGASLPGEAQVTNDFVEDYPGAELVGVSVGEGPRASAYVHFHFRPARTSEVNKVVWTYERQSGDWVVTHKAQPLLPLD